MTGSYVAFLGTKGGPAIRPGSTMPTSSLLVMDGRQIVVDCGLGVTRGLVDQGTQLKDLREIFITHMHSDHYLELGPLLHPAWTAGLAETVVVRGPDGLAAYWQNFLASMEADIALRIEDEGRPDLRTLVRIETVDDGTILDDSGLRVEAMRVIHPPLVDCFAFRFTSPSASVVFSGDTAFHPPLADFAKGADLLVHEAMLEAALPALFERIGNGSDRLKEHWARSHSTAAEAAQIATMAGVGTLALNHLIPSDDPDYTDADWIKAVSPHLSGTFVVARDGARVAIPGTAGS